MESGRGTECSREGSTVCLPQSLDQEVSPTVCTPCCPPGWYRDPGHDGMSSRLYRSVQGDGGPTCAGALDSQRGKH